MTMVAIRGVLRVIGVKRKDYQTINTAVKVVITIFKLDVMDYLQKIIRFNISLTVFKQGNNQNVNVYFV